jgi:DNA invertase Pin-like site-specific DNA recombinase
LNSQTEGEQIMAVALYARVSTTKQAEKDLSIPDQLQQMRDWCRRQGFTVAVEYVEPGASATDDRRPEFQRMIAEATRGAAPFEAIVVHSLSRFFRDSLEFALYERDLNKAGVKLISITQQTCDDSTGNMARRIFNLFDEYQSKENGKHTLRAMRENARQGYCNGARPTFGYRTVETEANGNKGKKKRLEIDPLEAKMVRQVFDLYLAGYQGEDMGAKAIAAWLNKRGLMMRRQRWTRSRVHEVLTNRTYMGEFVFNRRDKFGRLKAQSEWIVVRVPPVIAEDTYRQAQARLRSRAPAVAPPRVVNGPTLLTGMLKCGHCGAGMTLVTGKSGRYRYYKCQRRIGERNNTCDNPSVPMAKLDALVLGALAEKAFTPKRVKGMLQKLKEGLRVANAEGRGQLIALTKELKDNELAARRLYEVIERGIVKMEDAMLQQRFHELKVRREAILTELAGLRRGAELPASLLSMRRIDDFCRALRAKLVADDKGFAKRYLRLLVAEVRFTAKEVLLKGSYAALAQAVGQNGTLAAAGVPGFAPSWLPDLGSNQGPAD